MIFWESTYGNVPFPSHHVKPSKRTMKKEHANSIDGAIHVGIVGNTKAILFTIDRVCPGATSNTDVDSKGDSGSYSTMRTVIALWHKGTTTETVP